MILRCGAPTDSGRCTITRPSNSSELFIPSYFVRTLSLASSFEDISSASDLRAREIARRGAFAIISHPDAGKTTLTEKLLLYAGAIELAGAVRGSRTQRHAVSDFMEMEQQRGISISSAALEFELDGHHVTLLDTPGHQDFSEDTFRTLLAAGSAA